MRNQVPQFIQDNFQRGNHRGEFSAAGLFLDISGFSSMTDSLMNAGPHGAEIMAGVMKTVLDPLERYIYTHTGFIASRAGDAFTALFPGTEESINYALAAAWKIQKFLETHRTYETPYGRFDIQAKIGLAYGMVNWGIVLSKNQNRAAYYFQGVAVDESSEAEHLAQPGEIILQESAYNTCQTMVIVDTIADKFLVLEIIAGLPEEKAIIDYEGSAEIISLFVPDVLVKQSHIGEFRQVVNLFINLPTVRNLEQLTVFLNTLFELQDRYGGLFKSIDFGDKGTNALLFWGAPVAHENDIERTLNFIIELQAATSIPINAGVTYRIAHTGFIGSKIFEEYTCYGSGVNLAARIMTATSRGEIWLDENIAIRAKDLFDVELEGEYTFKGFAKKQTVYSLIDRKMENLPGYSNQFIGRENELHKLEQFIQSLAEGKYIGALVVWGEVGVGKSRLVHEFLGSKYFQDNHLQTVLCQTDEILREPFNPFKYWLRNYFELNEQINEARKKRNFNRILDALMDQLADNYGSIAGELDRVRSFLGAMVDLSWTDSLYEQLDPQARYDNTIIALTSILQALSKKNPLIIFIEDIQWLDEDSRSYLVYLNKIMVSNHVDDYPIAVIATARYEGEVAVLGVGFEYSELRLDGITSDNLLSLAQHQLGGELSDQLLDLLNERTEGNPFYLEQTLRYLIEEKLIQIQEDKWQVVQNLNLDPLPADIQTLLAARLDRLPYTVKEVVQAASTLGREFDYKILERMLFDRSSLLHLVSDAENAAIWRMIGEMRYLFHHILMRDAAYRMLTISNRQILHGLALQALEYMHKMDLTPYFGELAYHSENAGNNELAVKYLTSAGDSAKAVYQNRQALKYYTRALEYTPPNDFANQFELLMNREEVNTILADHSAQYEDLCTMQEIANQMLAEPEFQRRLLLTRVMNRWANYYLSQSNFQEAIDYARLALDDALAANSISNAVRAYLSWSTCLMRLGKIEDAISRANTALQLGVDIKDNELLGIVNNTLGMIYLEYSSAEDRAHHYFAEALRLARLIGYSWLIASSSNNLAMCAGRAGDYSRAMEEYEFALSLTREIGLRRYEALTLTNLGWIAGILGDYKKARKFCEQQLAILTQMSDQRGELYAYLNLGLICYHSDESQSAKDYIYQALESARRIGEVSAEAWALTTLGHILERDNQLDSAGETFQQAIEIRQELSQPNLACEPLAGLAYVNLRQGNITDACLIIQRLLEYLSQGGSLSGAEEPLRVYLICYKVLNAAQDDRALGILDIGYSLLKERAAKISQPEMRKSFLENVSFHQEIVRAWEYLHPM